MVKANRKKVTDKKRKRGTLFLFISILIFIYVVVSLITDNAGFIRMIEMHRTKSSLMKEIGRLEEDNSRLAKEIAKAKEDPEYIEALARDRLGLAKKGETVYRFAE